MHLIVHVGGTRAQWWKDTMQALIPDLECRLWDEPGDDREVEYAAVWKPPPGGLKRFANLKCIVSIGAGIDHLLIDPELPRHIPIIRTVGSELRQRMREYVVLHVLRLHRALPEIEAAQPRRAWHQVIVPPAPLRKVGIMGQGYMGADCARALATIGFDVAGWSRTPKTIDGIEGFHGAEGFKPFLARSEILVCLLPLTPETEGILNAELFQALPKGAFVINVGRGPHLVEADLLAALEAGQLAGATLDVFHQEPLPDDHPFWDHPAVLITPHLASLIDPLAGGRLVAQNLALFRAGKPVPDLVDLEQGY
ncbi:MAG: 2-hydroxyacid dehydrogenase [Planctomycetota bacterium]